MTGESVTVDRGGGGSGVGVASLEGRGLLTPPESGRLPFGVALPGFVAVVLRGESGWTRAAAADEAFDVPG